MKNSFAAAPGKGKLRVNRDLLFYILLLAFPLAQFCIFYIGVNFNSFLLAFQTYNTQTSTFQWDFGANFSLFWTELTTSSMLLDMLKNSLIAWFFATLLGTVGAVFFSYYIFKKFPAKHFFKFVLFLPSVLPSILLVMMFKTFGNEAFPAYIEVLFGTEVEGLFFNADTRLIMVIVYSVWIGFGTQVLIYTGSMEQISPSVMEAAKLDGAKPLRELWSVVIPEVLPAINTFLVTGIAQIFINQVNLWSFYGGTAAEWERTLGYYMFYLVNREDAGSKFYYYGYASALGLICTIIAIPLTYVVRHFLGKLEDK